MSALPPKADMGGAIVDVCFGPTADMRERECIFNRNGMKLRALGPKSNCVVRRCGPNLGESAVAKMRFTVALFVSTLVGVSVPASAEACPDNPDALGTSRVLTINPGEFIRIGTLQYKQTLELKDHEVVLTFDDGPLPPYTDIILDTLASQCVKATYFLVGQMAHAHPSIVRRIFNEAHTIGTHSQNHPRAFERLSMWRVEREVDDGINSVTTALGDAKALSPFFRLPGFGRTDAIERFLENKQLVTWSADVDTDDWWRGSTPEAIVKRAMRRLNAKGRGIILLHDIHRKTAIALPILLKELKANGYSVVHVVAGGEQPKSAPELMVSPTTDGTASPTALAGAPSSASQSHRIKKRSATRHHPAHSYHPSGLSEDLMFAWEHKWTFP